MYRRAISALPPTQDIADGTFAEDIFLLDATQMQFFLIEPQCQKTNLWPWCAFIENSNHPAYAFVQSNQRLLWSHEETFYLWLPKMHTVKILTRLCEWASWSESLLGAHFRRLNRISVSFKVRCYSAHLVWFRMNLTKSYEVCRLGTFCDYVTLKKVMRFSDLFDKKVQTMETLEINWLILLRWIAIILHWYYSL